MVSIWMLIMTIITFGMVLIGFSYVVAVACSRLGLVRGFGLCLVMCLGFVVGIVSWRLGR